MIIQEQGDVDLIYSFNKTIVNGEISESRTELFNIYLKEFEKRNLDHSILQNNIGLINLFNRNSIYLIENQLHFVNEYIMEIIDGQILVGELIERSRLHITLKIIFPFLHWRNSISIPMQALGTDRHFWKKKGNCLVKEYSRDLLKKSYFKLKTIDENIEIFVGLYDEYLEDIKTLEDVKTAESQEKILSTLKKRFKCNLDKTYGLFLSIYDFDQFERIMLAYKCNKIKIYLK